MQTSSYVVVVVCMLQNVEACQPGHSSDLHHPRLTVKISRVNCKTSLTGSLARGPRPSTTTRQRRPNNNNKMSNNTDMTTTWVYNVCTIYYIGGTTADWSLDVEDCSEELLYTMTHNCLLISLHHLEDSDTVEVSGTSPRELFRITGTR